MTKSGMTKIELEKMLEKRDERILALETENAKIEKIVRAGSGAGTYDVFSLCLPVWYGEDLEDDFYDGSILAKALAKVLA